MPRPERKPVKKEAPFMPLIPGQVWQDMKFPDGTRMVTVASVEDRTATITVVESLPGKPDKAYKTRVPASSVNSTNHHKLVSQ